MKLLQMLSNVYKTPCVAIVAKWAVPPGPEEGIIMISSFSLRSINFYSAVVRKDTPCDQCDQETSCVLPPECVGGPQSRTTPCPSRTLTALLTVWVLKFSRSVKGKCKIKHLVSRRV